MPDLKKLLEDSKLVQILCKNLEAGLSEGTLLKSDVENTFATARTYVLKDSPAYRQLYAFGEAIGIPFPAYSAG